MKMLILALDTTTRSGSVAVMREQEVVACEVGNPDITHGQRLPGDVLHLLAKEGLTLGDVTLFAVCSGPGSFTGLRVGLATIQGLALTSGAPVVAVPTLEALAYAGASSADGRHNHGVLIVPWMNGQRGEVFGAVYQVTEEADRLDVIRAPAVGTSQALLADWAELLAHAPVEFIGDAVAGAQESITETGRDVHVNATMPPLAPVIAQRAAATAATAATSPHAIRPVYVRRPDAELARERQRDRRERPDAR